MARRWLFLLVAINRVPGTLPSGRLSPLALALWLPVASRFDALAATTILMMCFAVLKQARSEDFACAQF